MLAQFLAVEDDFMLEAHRAKVGRALDELLKVGVRLGYLDLRRTLKTAIVVEEFADPVPDLHRALGDRHLGIVAAKPAHAAGIHAGGMSADRVLFDHHDVEPAHGCVKRRRAAVDAPTDDKEIHRPVGHIDRLSGC